MSVIIKHGKLNWSGKEFSALPAKIYSSFEDAANAIDSYHLFSYDPEKGAVERRDGWVGRISFEFLSEARRDKMVEQGQAQF